MRRMPSAEEAEAGLRGTVEVEDPAAPKQGFNCGLREKVGGCCCCLLLVVLVAVFWLLPWFLSQLAWVIYVSLQEDLITRYIGDGYDLSNLTYKTGWLLCQDGDTIARFDSGCGEECYDTTELPRAMQASFEGTPGTRAKYPSRSEAGIQDIELGGWVLPAEGNSSDISSAPRIVVQHGFAGNSNTLGALLVGYYLRQMGFSVLLNNFRDHGYSGRSELRRSEWGGSYTYDVLGAWDYLVSDPDGLLGGPIAPAKVGIIGFSKGAFMTLNAFGLEGRVGAAWADSPPFSPQTIVNDGVRAFIERELGMPFLVPIVQPRTWTRVLRRAEAEGVQLLKNLPEKNLPMGPSTRRPLALTTTPDDEIVPVTEFLSVLSLLQGHTDKYAVEHFYTNSNCRGSSHCLGILLEKELYLEKMCVFFKNAFGEDNSTCPMSALGQSMNDLFKA